MKHFKNCAAQGDVYILRVKSLPAGIKPVTPLAFKPGIYRVINQRESAPEGWRKASD